MTIAISLKINDGLVLASDSASTLMGVNPTGGGVAVFNVYNNADKVFNLKKGLPIGAVTWGAGSIGQASTSTILKDLRKVFTDGDEEHFPGWQLDDDSYTLEQVANRLKEFVYDRLYVPAFREHPQKPDLGFIVAGYSANASMAEEFQIDIKGGVCNGPRLLRTREQVGISWGGNAEPLNRLIIGMSSALPPVLQSMFRVPPQQLQTVVNNIQQHLQNQAPILVAPMPLQDAIELAEFLVDVTIKFSRFMPGPPTVGGPIDIAAISKHEGFRWIKRKYYFERKLNPDERFLSVYKPGKEGEVPADDA